MGTFAETRGRFPAAVIATVAAIACACGGSPAAPNTPAVPIMPVIQASQFVTSGATSTASVAARTGMSYRWTISGGTIANGEASGVTANATNSISYVAGAVGTLTLTCAEINAKGAASEPGRATVSVVSAPFTPTIRALTPVRAGLGADAYVDARSGMTYRWTVSGGTIVTAGDGDVHSIVYTSAEAGTLILSCSEINAAGTASEPATATVIVTAAQDGVLDCAWLHSRNCWKTSVVAAAACNPGSVGTFSADRRSCSFDSGEQISFANGGFSNPPYQFSIGSCVTVAQPDAYTVRLTTGAGVVGVYGDPVARTLEVTCPDGSSWLVDAGPQSPLLGCNWGEALLPDVGWVTEPYGDTSFYLRGGDRPPGYTAGIWTCH